MSGGTASSAESIVLHVPLLNEGTDVIRPTTGVVLGPDTVEILPTAGYHPADEEWEFPPGSKVRCVSEVRGGVQVLVARHRAQ